MTFKTSIDRMRVCLDIVACCHGNGFGWVEALASKDEELRKAMLAVDWFSGLFCGEGFSFYSETHHNMSSFCS